MSGEISVLDKFGYSETNKYFWLKTFKNAFTYSVYDGYINLFAWDGVKGEFKLVTDDDFKNYHKIEVNEIDYAYRITLDNNYKVVDDKFSLNKSNLNLKQHRNHGNQAVMVFGTDLYILSSLKRLYPSQQTYLDILNRCCVKQFGDAIQKSTYEYYWNYEEGVIDTTYEKYTTNTSLLKSGKKPYKLILKAEDSIIDKYKEEDSSYIVDRYF